MRLRAMALLLLLVPLSAAQDAERSTVMAPVQTVVDAVPDLVELAVAEARFDGSPDDADELAAQMQRFVQGLDGSLRFPDESAASRQELSTALSYLQELTAFTTAIPGDVGQVSVQSANCDAYGAGRGADEATAWIQAGRSAGARIEAYRAGLLDLATRSPDGVDPGPLQSAAEALDGFIVVDVADSDACFDEVEQELGLPPSQPFLTLRLLPETTYPTGQVRAIASIRGAELTEAELTIPSLGIASELAVQERAVFARIDVPADASLGDHEVRLEAGDLHDNATLHVQAADSFLRVTRPSQVEVGAPYRIDVTVRTPVTTGVGGGPMHFSQGIDAEVPIVAREASIEGRAPDAPGPLRIHIEYPGSRIVQAANATILIDVIDPQAAQTVPPPVTPPAGRDGLSFRFFGIDLSFPYWVLLATAAIILAAVALRRLLRPRDVASTPAPFFLPPPDGLPQRGFLAAMAAFMGWLRHLGRAQPGTTVREAAAGSGDPHLQGMVEPFERIRYGHAQETPQASQRAPGLLARLLERIRGSS